MATTSPDNLYSPDSVNPYNLTVDLAAMQTSVQAAITSVRSGTSFFRGSTSQRNSATAVKGDYWSDTTDMFLYKYDGSRWLYAPGQVLAYMSASATVGVAGSIVGTVARTPSLPIGQKVRVRSSRVSMYVAGAAGEVYYALRARNNASDVTNVDFTKTSTSRTYQRGSSNVTSCPGVEFQLTTSVAAPVSAALFVEFGVTYGVDGQEIWIESA